MNNPPQPLKVNSVAEEYQHIATLKCERCGGTYHVIRQSLLINGPTPMDAVEIVCQTCGQAHNFLFDISSFFGK
ncbi:MAG: hypothetical protein ABIQ44_13870 [Chloroflexia bacterium]